MVDKCCIIDVDGTLIDSERRFRLGQRGSRLDWNFILDPAIVRTLDRPMPREIIEKIKQICEELGCNKIVILTGRPEKLREITIQQLCEINMRYDELIMRKNGDFRKEIDYKLSIIQEISRRYNIVAVFDDNEEVLKCIRALFPNIRTFKVSKEGVEEYKYRGLSILNFLEDRGC